MKAKPLVVYLSSAWTTTVSVGAIFLLAKGAQAAGIDGVVSGLAFASIAAIGGVTGTYRLTRKEN